MLKGRAAQLGADFAALKARLMAATDSSERATVVAEMESILKELEQLIRIAEEEDDSDPIT
jgi:hypothetical protein